MIPINEHIRCPLWQHHPADIHFFSVPYVDLYEMDLSLKNLSSIYIFLRFYPSSNLIHVMVDYRWHEQNSTDKHQQREAQKTHDALQGSFPVALKKISLRMC